MITASHRTTAARLATAVAACCVAAAVIAAPGRADATMPQGRPVGIGLDLGEPTGLTVKWFLSDRIAWDFTAGLGFFDDAISLWADWLIHAPIETAGSTGVDVYFGVGPGFYERHDDPGFAVRGIAGFAFVFGETPLDLCLEIAPGLLVVPEPDFFIGGALSLRYWLP